MDPRLVPGAHLAVVSSDRGEERLNLFLVVAPKSDQEPLRLDLLRG